MIKIIKYIILLVFVAFALKGYEAVNAEDVFEPVREVTNCEHGDTLTREICDKFEPVVEQVQEFELPEFLPATGDTPIIGK